MPAKAKGAQEPRVVGCGVGKDKQTRQASGVQPSTESSDSPYRRRALSMILLVQCTTVQYSFGTGAVLRRSKALSLPLPRA